MKNILVITATDTEYGEAQNLLTSFEDGEKNICVIKGGVGKTEMAYRLSKKLAEQRYDYLINIGVAGSLKPCLKAFDAVFATKVAYYDFDLTAFGNKMGQTDGNPLYFEADKKAKQIAESLDEKIYFGTIISGDRFVTKNNMPENVDEDFDDPMAIDMESAVVGHVAYLEKIPFVILRTISDSVESNRDDAEYENKKANSSKLAVSLVYKIIEQL